MKFYHHAPPYVASILAMFLMKLYIHASIYFMSFHRVFSQYFMSFRISVLFTWLFVSVSHDIRRHESSHAYDY